MVRIAMLGRQEYGVIPLGQRLIISNAMAPRFSPALFDHLHELAVVIAQFKPNFGTICKVYPEFQLSIARIRDTCQPWFCDLSD